MVTLCLLPTPLLAAATAPVRALQQRKQRNALAYRSPCRRFAAGIWAHRQASGRADLTAEPHDQQPWELLEELTIDHGSQQPCTLATLLADRVWQPKPGSSAVA